jgi:hypothetical protein
LYDTEHAGEAVLEQAIMGPATPRYSADNMKAFLVFLIGFVDLVS